MLSLKLDLLSEHTLLLRQTRYSATLQKLITQLPNRKWNGSGWELPITDITLVRQKFAGVRLIESEDVQKLASLPAREPRVEAAIDMRGAGDPEPSIEMISDYTFKTEPFLHQIKAFRLARNREAFALLMEMGTGKTKVTVDLLSYWKQLGQIDGALIVCPKNALFNWERELAIHSPLEVKARRTLVLAGSGKTKLQALQKGAMTCQFFITNYATLLGLEEELQHLLKRLRLAIVLDESTNIKSPTAKTSKAAWRLSLLSQRRLILTGSPITQSPLDAFSQFKFLDTNILGHHNFYSFRNEFGIMAKRPGIPWPIVSGFKNVERLHKRIAPHSYRVLKKDCLDLPEKIYQTVELEMGPKQKELYQKMRDEAVVQLQGQTLAAPLVITRFLRLQQITAGFLPKISDRGEDLGTVPIEDAVKTAACLELVQAAVEGGQQVIVWVRFIPELERLGRALADGGIPAVLYHGAVTAADRQTCVDQFQSGAARVMVAQISTGGTAITLTAASLVVYHSNSFALADRLQSEDRAHRIGQKRNVQYIDLVCKGSIDRLVLRTLKEKKNLADIVTGDVKSLLLEEE